MLPELPEEPLLAAPVLVDVDVDVAVAAEPVVVAVVVATFFCSAAQKDENQTWMLLRPPASAVQALSQTPAVPVLKGVRRALLQKHEAYWATAAVVTAGGTQAPLAS